METGTHETLYKTVNEYRKSKRKKKLRGLQRRRSLFFWQIAARPQNPEPHASILRSSLLTQQTPFNHLTKERALRPRSPDSGDSRRLPSHAGEESRYIISIVWFCSISAFYEYLIFVLVQFRRQKTHSFLLICWPEEYEHIEVIGHSFWSLHCDSRHRRTKL